MTRDGTNDVKRRRVFYIPGYDPIPPRRYRELYREHGARQAQVSRYALDLGPRRGDGPFGWHVSATIEDRQVETDIEVMVWSDLVRDSMERGILATYVQMLRTAWIYIASGALFRLARLRKGPVIAALYPVVFLVGQLLVALALARVAGWGLGLLHPFAAWAGLLVVPPVLAGFRRIDNRLFAYYLMHDYAYSAQFKGANPPALEARLATFTDRIAAALAEDIDEVLVVGHSSGAHLAVSVLSDLLRAGHGPGARRPALGLLTLGQVVPMVSFLPDARRLRADLRYLSESEALAWVDVTAPGDGCAFALCDPVAVTGVATAQQRWPLVISAAFSETLSPPEWRRLRRRFFRLHFQYLCAFDRPRDYDYFRITAGPRTLAARFAGRAPSPSRLRRPVSGYRDTGAG
jgi:hypothetical protein